MKNLIVSLIFVGAFANSALASKVTFEGYSPNSLISGVLTSGELTFKIKAGQFYINNPYPTLPKSNNAFLAGEGHYSEGNTKFNFGGAFSFNETYKRVFSLQSIDMAAYYGPKYASNKVGRVVITGHQQDGKKLKKTLALGDSLKKYVFSWKNLLSVDLSENANFGYLVYDNFQVNVNPPTGNQGVNAVPVPAAVWLFGSAIVGLLGVGKRKQRMDF
jgi:hypothetical protein